MKESWIILGVGVPSSYGILAGESCEIPYRHWKDDLLEYAHEFGLGGNIWAVRVDNMTEEYVSMLCSKDPNVFNWTALSWLESNKKVCNI